MEWFWGVLLVLLVLVAIGALLYVSLRRPEASDSQAAGHAGPLEQASAPQDQQGPSDDLTSGSEGSGRTIGLGRKREAEDE